MYPRVSPQNSGALKQPDARFLAVFMEHDYTIFDNLRVAS
jgi:hypothetical protein